MALRNTWFWLVKGHIFLYNEAKLYIWYFSHDPVSYLVLVWRLLLHLAVLFLSDKIAQNQYLISMYSLIWQVLYILHLVI